ncbi:MAG: MFS transporter [SAR324 cluster bacterium]|nr:MFS transporter [SAR324 cluster bacterium]
MPDFALSRGVISIVVVFIATAIAVGSAQYSFGLFIAPLAETFAWSRTALSASASFAALSGLTAPFLGRALDKYGARPVLLGSLTVMGAGFVMRPWMSELWHWYALSLLQFVCFAGTTSLPAGKLVAAWFPHARGRVMGIAAIGNNFGGLTVPFTVTLIMTSASWREAFVALGVTCFLIGALAWFFVIDGPPSPPVDESDKAGRQSEKSNSLFAGVNVSRALRTPAFYIVFLVVMLGFFTYSTALTHMSAHLLNRGFSTTKVSIALSALALGGILGKIVFGLLLDRFGGRWATMINLLGQAIMLFTVAWLTTAEYLFLAMPAFGVFMGGFGIVSTLLVQECFGLRYFGSIMGLMNLGTVAAFGLGPLMAGLSYDWTGTYSWAFAVVAGFFVIAALALLSPAVTRIE